MGISRQPPIRTRLEAAFAESEAKIRGCLEKGTVVQTIRVGDRPVAATVDPDTHIIFVTNSGSASVSMIDTDTRAVTGTLDVGDGP